MNTVTKVSVGLAMLGIFALPSALRAEDITVKSSAGEFNKVGAAGAQFLKIGAGARATGMAGAFTAIANDPTALYWNVAGISDIKSLSASVQYTQWFAGFSHSFASCVVPIGQNYRGGLSFVSFNSGNIPITTLDAEKGTRGTYSVGDFAVAASFGGYITQQFAFGATLRYNANTFGTLSSDGVSFDLGTLYRSGYKGMSFGFSIQNLGGMQNYSGQDLNTSIKIVDQLNASKVQTQMLTNPHNLPLTFRAGAAFDVMSIINGVENTPDGADDKLTAAVDFVTLSDTPEQFAIGAEYTFMNLISARAGYRMGHDSFGLAGGIGLQYISGDFNGQIDYSINPVVNIGLVNRIGLTMKF
ncbi:hypothetical protein MASR2M18_13940 [Ignavibacteria bacterium]|nr:PorV/PorQ family protein [Bacteroidota bacterium]MCZ2133210.1 PorV/PorQ family protein [Bacteroidota bacterium]